MTSKGQVPGATLRERAEFLAGVLAENGVGELRWRPAVGAEREFVARETDLPGILMSERGELICPAIGLVVERVGDGLVWSSGDEGGARMFDVSRG